MKEGKKHINSGLAKKYGKPLCASHGEYTQSKTTGGMAKSINSNKNTASTRIGYGVNGV